MKFLVLFFFIFTFSCAFGQFSSRAGFAGSMPKGDLYADVHPNFRTTVAPTNAVTANGANVANRNAGDESGPTSSTTSTTARPRNPDEIYMTWPRENRPFDVLNRAQIDQQLHPERQQNTGGNVLQSRSDIPTRNNPVIGQIASRGSFAGSLPKGDIYSDVNPVFKTGSSSSTQTSTSTGTSTVQSRYNFPGDNATPSVDVDTQGHHHHHHHHHLDQPSNVNYDHIQQLKSSRRDSY